MRNITLVAVLVSVACTNATDASAGRLAIIGEGASDPFRLPSAPSEETLCEIIFDESSQAEIEKTLGTTNDLSASPASVTLGYDFEGGLKLLLTVEQGVFDRAAVYNGDYPECWTDEERMHDAALLQAAMMQAPKSS
jgi:hypothetical protein